MTLNHENLGAFLADCQDMAMVGAAAAAENSHLRKCLCQRAIAAAEIGNIARIECLGFVKFGMALR